MTLAEIFTSCGIKPEDMHKYLDWHITPHQAGEKADEIVAAVLVPEIKSIYVEYE